MQLIRKHWKNIAAWSTVALLWLGIVSLILFLVPDISADLSRPKPTPTSSATPTDPLKYYKSLPTAEPGCPKDIDNIDPGRYFYRNCPETRKRR